MNKSIQRAVEILECLTRSQRPLGISELARQLNIPKSSASDCLYTLLDCGCVVMDADKSFSIGPTIARLGAAALKLDRLKPAVGDILQSLHRRLRRPILLFVENAGMALCAARVDDERGGIHTIIVDCKSHSKRKSLLSLSRCSGQGSPSKAAHLCRYSDFAQI